MIFVDDYHLKNDVQYKTQHKIARDIEVSVKH